jgi:hypothetical protein
MGDAMRALAEKTKINVAEELGYDNIEVKKASLEGLPSTIGLRTWRFPTAY